MEQVIEQDGQDQQGEGEEGEGEDQGAAAVYAVYQRDDGKCTEDAGHACREGVVFCIGEQDLADCAVVAEGGVEEPGGGGGFVDLAGAGPEFGHCAGVVEAEAVLFLGGFVSFCFLVVGRSKVLG